MKEEEVAPLSAEGEGHYGSTEPHKEQARVLFPIQQRWHLVVLVPASVACIFLFAFGQAGNEWAVELVLRSGLSNSVTKTLKSFNLFQSIHALEDEDQMGLALLLWVTSVVWPYVKLLLTLGIFFFALRWPRLEAGLSWVEHLGKWNHVDVIVCYLMMLVVRLKVTALEAEAGFNSTFNVPHEWLSKEQQILAGAPFPLEVQVNGKEGLYLYCTGVCFSMLTGHLTEWMVWSRKNRQTSVLTSMLGDTPRYRQDSSLSVLREHPTAPQDGKSIRLVQLLPAGWQRWLASLLLVGNAVMFVCAISVNYISVEYTLPVVSKDDRAWSVLTGLGDVLTMSRDHWSDQAGTQFVGVLLLVFSVLAPAVRQAIQLYTWMVPVGPRSLRTLMIAMEVASAWSGLDVLLLAVGVTSAEMGGLTEGLGHKLFNALHLDVQCNKCLKFDLNIEGGYWVILTHTVASMVSTYLVRKLYDSALQEETSREEKQDLNTIEFQNVQHVPVVHTAL